MTAIFRLVLLAAAFAANAAVAAPCKGADPALAGHYYLEGEMEVGSELLLRPDGEFEYMLAYGAIDQYGKGCWSRSGKVLALAVRGRKVPATHSPVDRRFRGMYLIVEKDGRLGWTLPGFRGRYVRH